MQDSISSFNIVCISPAPWDYPIWTNRQHIMNHLSKSHKVIYLFQPTFLRSALKRIITKKNFSFFKKINNNLYILTPPIIPGSEYSLKVHNFNILLGSYFLKKLLSKLNISKYIVWFYDPEAVRYLDCLKPIFSCYDCVDEYSAMPMYVNPKRKNRLISSEKHLIQRCDQVFTTSQYLFDSKQRYNKSTFLVENVGDFHHFNINHNLKWSIPADFPEGNGHSLVFVGAVDPYKVDFKLLEYVAVHKPEWRIVLIGKVVDSHNDNFNFPKNKNIFYLGHKDYSIVPHYLLYASVCIIPYLINDYTNGVFPIKLFEYLATGKPVVSTSLPSLNKFKSTIQIAETPDDFISKVQYVISHDTNKLQMDRTNLANNNTWEHRANRLLEHVIKGIKED